MLKYAANADAVVCQCSTYALRSILGLWPLVTSGHLCCSKCYLLLWLTNLRVSIAANLKTVMKPSKISTHHHLKLYL